MTGDAGHFRKSAIRLGSVGRRPGHLVYLGRQRRKVRTIQPEVVRRMREEAVGALAVFDDGTRIYGIISDPLAHSIEERIR